MRVYNTATATTTAADDPRRGMQVGTIMDQPFWDALNRQEAGHPLPPDQLSAALDAACLRLAELLGGCDPSARQDLLALVPPRILALMGQNGAPGAPQLGAAGSNDATADRPKQSPPPGFDELPGPQPRKLTPEEMEWAMQQFSEEEFFAGLREIEETGGRELHEFLHELEQAAGLHE